MNRLGLRLMCLLILMIFSSGFAHGLERTPDRVRAVPPQFGDYCWHTNHLAFDIPDTLCWDLIWNWSGFRAGDVVGMSYIGDMPCGSDCATLDIIYLYFAEAIDGPGDEVRFQVFCADASGAPVGDPITALDLDPDQGMQIISLDGLPLSSCIADGVLRFIVTICWLTDSGYPHIATDNMQTIQELGCRLPPGYPRSDPSEVRSRYFNASAACAPVGSGSLFQDDLDNLELAWTFAMTCTPPTPAVSTTWGRVRSLSR